MFHKRLSNYGKRLKNFLVALLFVGTQIVFPIAMSGVAHAAVPPPLPSSDCTIDTNGANDVPGQKDLTKMCADTSGLPTTEHITWNWDELGSSGSNTLDACALFDTNGDGNAEYSACVTTLGNPATLSALTVYSCNNTSGERCFGSTVVLAPLTAASCQVYQQDSDPFNSSAPNGPGDSYPTDTVADCTVHLSEVGGQSVANLIDVCSYPSSSPNSDPSDCVVAVPGKAKLEVVKSLSPSNDPGLFDLKIDGTTKATGVGNNGSTGEQIVVVKNTTHSVSEAANSLSPTTLSAYSSNIVCKDLHGTGNVVANGSGTSLSNITLAADSDVVCTITNTRQTGSIKLIKSVTENNGGTAGVNDFGLTIGGQSVNSGDTLTLNPGNYAINEAGKTGYQFVSLTGTGCPSSLGGNVTLAANQNVTCTITNDDIAPSLTVVKNVTNDNGGTAQANAFTLRVNSTQLTGGVLSNSNLTDTYTVSNPQAGSAYTVSEDAFTGYSSSGFTCKDNSNNQTVSNPVTLSLGQNVTCSVTNNDTAPQLTLVKHVTNDNGGTNTAGQWTLKAQHSTDPAVINQQGTESNGGLTATTSTVAVNANTSYALSESGPSGYSPSTWNCNGGLLSNGSVTLGVGDNVTCTITNDDIAPLLTVTKVVNNNNGGTLVVSNFPLNVSGTSVTSGVQTSFSAGKYTVGETQQQGYTLFSVTGDCLSNGNITMVVGGVYTCTLTNNDVPANITVTKVVHNNHGGTAKESDFTLKVGSTTVTSGVTNTFAANHQYTVSEVAQVNGYQQDSLVCTDTDTQANLGATFTPTLAENIACTITNSDIAPQLTVIKHVVNNNGGNAQASDFTMKVTGTNVAPSSSFPGAENPGTTVTLDAGTYSVDESGGPSGYTKSIGQNCSGTIALGAQVTCVITNTDVAPTLTIVKKVVDNNGGNNPANSFTVNVNGSALTGGVLSNGNNTDTYTNPGTQSNTPYTVSENDPSPGYTQASLVCKDNATGGTVSNPVTLASGQNVTCTITNNDVAPTLKVVKNVTNDNGGTTKADAFTLRVNNGKLTGGTLSNSDQADTYTYSNAQSNTNYTFSEDSFFGYTPSAWSCTDNDTHQAVTLTNNGLSLNEGQNVTCSITNDDVAPTITVNKVIDPSNDNGKFDLSVNGVSNNFSSTTTDQTNGGTTGKVTVTNGTYTVGEAASADSPSLLTDYSSTWSCDNGTTGTGTTSDSFSVGSGDAVSCTFTNTRLGSITIAKVADPQSSQGFTFTGNLQGDNTPNFILVDDGLNDGLNQKTFDHVTPDKTYTVTEPNVKGWTLTEVNCVGGNDTDTHNRNAVIKLGPGENVTCTFFNSRDHGTITVNKRIVSSEADSGVFNLNINGETSFTATDQGDGGTTGAQSVVTGSYTVSETAGTDTNMNDYVSSYSCSNDMTGSGTETKSFDLNKGDSVTCTFTNFRKATIVVTKYNDIDHSGTYDPNGDNFGVNEPALPGWDITLTNENGGVTTPQTTGSDGTTTFNDVVPSAFNNNQNYILDEVLQSGWNRSFGPDSDSNIYCVYPDEQVGAVVQGQYVVEPGAGDVINCFVGNYQNPALTITKTNDKPNPTVDGDTVTYTLQVTVPEDSGAVFDATVADVPPANFTVDNTNFTATSNDPNHDVAGDIAGSGGPNYGSPGIWHLGNLKPGEKITLIYKAKIGNNVSNGTYPDLAFTSGCSVPLLFGFCLGNTVTGNLNAASPFVSSKVTVAAAISPVTFAAGQVLGAEVLVNTGTNLLAAQYILPIVLLSGVYLIRRWSATQGGK